MPSSYQRRQTAKRRVELQGWAQEHRRQPTLSEARLWEELRGGRLGVTFRRQVIIGASSPTLPAAKRGWSSRSMAVSTRGACGSIGADMSCSGATATGWFGRPTSWSSVN
jgi:uncharacterized protein DUF559